MEKVTKNLWEVGKTMGPSSFHRHLIHQNRMNSFRVLIYRHNGEKKTDRQEKLSIRPGDKPSAEGIINSCLIIGVDVTAR